MDIAIIGAGITGLTAAYDLTQRGHDVTVYEARTYAGGLAAGFRDDRWEWHLEHFYHHWFASDNDLIGLIEELGARDRLFFHRPTTTLYHRGRLYPLDSPVPWLRFIPFPALHRAIRVLQFAPLPLDDRLRAGVVGAYLTLVRDWRPLESVSAHDWMRRTVGQRAYEVLWRPLLVSKFGEERYQDVNMAWMWARLYKRTARLGYFEGGFQAFIDLLVEHVQHRGGTVRFSAAVRGIVRDGKGLCLRLDADDAKHQKVIATCSPHAMLKLTPELPAPYASKLRRLESMGAVALVLALTRPLTPGHYWINLPKGAEIPFMGLVEHTNYISREHYGGDHLVYCGDYLPPDHPYFDTDKERLSEIYLPGLERINPDFQPDWVRASWMFKERYAQPVPGLDHLQIIPGLKTPIPGLWMANMSLVYPWDRGSNYAVEIGRRVARLVVEEGQRERLTPAGSETESLSRSTADNASWC
ncbi:MAG: NAD(P)/FAD-dependent oxidoreductase [Anaerolineae bacterium]|jgi:protoporphyrinogen oxidase